VAWWGVVLLGMALIWFSTTYDHSAVGISNSTAVRWLGVLTVVSVLADLFAAFRRRSQSK
jgi:hypothetical protein